MAAPDLCSPTKVEGKNAFVEITTTAGAIVANAASSGSLIRVVSVYVTNVDSTNDATVTIDVYDGTDAGRIRTALNVPADSTITILTRDEPLYLEEGDSLRMTASANDDLTAIAFYEKVS